MATFNQENYKKALRVLDANPKKIEDAQRTYQKKLEELKQLERAGHYGKVYIDGEKRKAAKERDRVCNALAAEMRPALETVKNTDYDAAQIDLENPKLKNALNIVSMMGENLSYTDAAGILQQFRGDPGSLRVLEGVFRKKGQGWAADNAKEMQKGVSKQAIDEMSEVLSFYSYAKENGEFSFPLERAAFTRGEFGRCFSRMGYDPNSVPDSAFDLALDTALESLRAKEIEYSALEDNDAAARGKARILAKKLKVKEAKREIEKAKTLGIDPAAVFNKAMASLEDAEA